MEDKILLAHGSGGALSHDFVERFLVKAFHNPLLTPLDDSATFKVNGTLAFTTDSYVVSPLFFPGGDIGRLAVCGTVNDLAMAGAIPLYLSLALIIEEGFAVSDFEKIVASIKQAALEANVTVVAGDTKVVNRSCADNLFITTAGLGSVPEGIYLSGSNAQVGDAVVLSGPIGEHGIAVLSQREGLAFETTLVSDCAPLHMLVAEMLGASTHIHCLRDPTRGGLASTLNEFAGKSNVGIAIEQQAIPIKESVRAACELLGFDPLYIANEGKLVAVVSHRDAEKVVAAMRKNPYGAEAAIIGRVVQEHPGKVVMKTPFGTSRIIDMLAGELLPRIC